MRLYLVLPLILAGCTSPGAAEETGPDRIATLAPGETIALSGEVRLRFVSVESDSRCPPRVQCIHAGEATLLFELGPASGGRHALRLTTTPPADHGVAGAWQLKLRGLDHGAPPRATVQISRTD